MAATSQIPASVPIASPAPRLRAIRLLHLWHLTSFDAPTVAVVWTLAFAKAARIPLPLWIPLVLALLCWAIYLADRLLDARSAATQLQPRHHFHWRHRRLFLPLAMAAVLVALALVLADMPATALSRNLLLALAALLYFAGVHTPHKRWPFLQSLRFSRLIPTHLAPARLAPKELLVAIIFTLACVIPVWARAASPIPLLPAIAAFILLAWLNCHAIETWDSHRRSSRAPSLALAAACALAAIQFPLQPRTAALLASAALSALLLALLDHRSSRLTPLTLRAAADLVLLTPLALLAFR